MAFFWFVGRDDDIIKTAGYRVSPQEVEEILIKHPAISEVAVVGKPHPKLGQIVKAFVVLKPGFKPSAELEGDIISFVKASMTPYKAPREIEFIDELPKTPTGKIRRKELAVMEKQGDMQ
jgi:acyl-coenzyme A synthetase/AMP-(fatty) acid ligase